MVEKNRNLSTHTDYTIYAEGLEKSKGRTDFFSTMLVSIGFLQGLADQIERGEYLTSTLGRVAPDLHSRILDLFRPREILRLKLSR